MMTDTERYFLYNEEKSTSVQLQAAFKSCVNTCLSPYDTEISWQVQPMKYLHTKFVATPFRFLKYIYMLGTCLTLNLLFNVKELLEK